MRLFSDYLLKEINGLGICLKDSNVNGYNNPQEIEDEELELLLKIKQTKYLKTIKNLRCAFCSPMRLFQIMCNSRYSVWRVRILC